jgi:hypothetical protein
MTRLSARVGLVVGWAVVAGLAAPARAAGGVPLLGRLPVRFDRYGDPLPLRAGASASSPSRVQYRGSWPSLGTASGSRQRG